MRGNPGGRPALPPELKAVKAMRQGEACRLIAKYARMPFPEIQAICLAKTAPAIELAIARIFEESVKKGDDRRLTFLLDRAIGKAPQAEIDWGDDDNDALAEITRLSDDELRRRVGLKTA